MKKTFILLLFLIFSCALIGYSQPEMFMSGPKAEKLEALKIAHITKEVGLTSTEAKVFWPVYDQFQDEMKSLRKGILSEAAEAKTNFDNMSDKEVEKVTDDYVASKMAEAELIKKYHLQFKSILTAKKVAKLYRAEFTFKRELLKQIQGRPEGGGPPPGGKPGGRF